jgi:excisionase family DNA binding protein
VTPDLTTEQLAELFDCSTRTVRELTRTGSIPHRWVPGQRRCLFLVLEIAARLDGANARGAICRTAAASSR